MSSSNPLALARLTHRLVSDVLDHALHHGRLALDERDVPAGGGVVEEGSPARPPAAAAAAAVAPSRRGGAALAPPVAPHHPRVVVALLVPRPRMSTASWNVEGETKESYFALVLVPLELDDIK